MSFYLGSRYTSGSFDGNQTVEALEMVPFTVGTGGSHKLKFMGTATGDHTAFLSGVSIETAGGLTVSPTSVFPGFTIAVSASGFAPSETVDLVGYASPSPARSVPEQPIPAVRWRSLAEYRKHPLAPTGCRPSGRLAKQWSPGPLA